ncbi:MAG: methyltransferase [Hahellaceae bacterium]|jgi:hypothetical protein|nr:methyltransferase [Hahellaceae bacterium]
MFSTTFQALDHLLTAQQPLFTGNPYRDPEHYRSQLSERQWSFIQTIPVAELDALQANDQNLLARMADHFPCVDEIQRLINGIPHLPPSDATRPISERDFPSVPGRKLEQIRGFVGALGVVDHPIVEWCAGKAHLGRCLHRLHQQPVRSLELNPMLVEEGRRLANTLPVQLEVCNVMEPIPSDWIAPTHHIIGLHACGDLHRRMLTLATLQKAHRISLSPCCYQLTRDTHYVPLSQAGYASTLRLNRDILHTAIRGSITQPANGNRQRKQLQAWRLGFDLLQRQITGSTTYLNQPSVSTAILQKGFGAFCQHIADHHGLRLPSPETITPFEALGTARFESVARLDLVRSLFRRVLELWLVTDMALYLEEQGYSVTLQTYCPGRISPRNLLIDARR